MPATPLRTTARLAAATQLLLWTTGTSVAAVALVLRWPAPPVRPAAGPSLEDLLTAAACAALLLVLVAAAAGGWASLVLAAARRGGSMRLAGLERAAVPRVLRRLAATAVGVGVLAGAGAGAASAAPAPVTVALAPLVPSWPAETTPPPAPVPAPATSDPAQGSPGTPLGTDTGAGPGRTASLAPPPRGVEQVGPVVVVEPGDCLWRIAAEHLPPGAGAARVAAEWPRWWAANRDVVGPDPDLILPGQHLRAPVGQDAP